MLSKLVIGFTAAFIGLTGVALAQSSSGGGDRDRPSAVECQRPVHMSGCDSQTNPNIPDNAR
jgi:hypothetical protein